MTEQTPDELMADAREHVQDECDDAQLIGMLADLAEQLAAKIEQAPHGYGCMSTMRAPYHRGPCDCWKSTAPHVALAQVKADAWDHCLDEIEQNEINTAQARKYNPYRITDEGNN
jgi:hypothetical protein